MTGRRTFANDEDREFYELDQIAEHGDALAAVDTSLADHETRIDTLESAGGGTDIRTASSIVAPTISMGDTTWADLDTAHDKVLAAAAGDVLVVSVSGRVHNTTAVECYLDVVTVVGGLPVTSLGTKGAAPTGNTEEGIPSLLVTSGAAMPLSATVQIVLGAGDVDGGQVTARLRYRRVIGGARNLDKPLIFTATVYTPT